MLLILKTALALLLLQGSPQLPARALAAPLRFQQANDPPAQPLPPAPARPQRTKKS
jgi:hypothetical protein